MVLFFFSGTQRAEVVFHPAVISLNKTPQIKMVVEIRPHQSESLIVLVFRGYVSIPWLLSDTSKGILSSLDHYYNSYYKQRVQPVIESFGKCPAISE